MNCPINRSDFEEIIHNVEIRERQKPSRLGVNSVQQKLRLKVGPARIPSRSKAVFKSVLQWLALTDTGCVGELEPKID